MSEELQLDDIVMIPWGVGEVRGRAVEIYGTSRRMVVVELTPELSGYVAAEPTTIVFPIDRVRRADVAV